MDFSTKIKAICREKSIQMKELAEMLGITPTGLSKSIGQPYPQLQTLERIATALECDVIDFFPRPTSTTVHCPNCGARLKVIVVEDGPQGE